MENRCEHVRFCHDCQENQANKEIEISLLKDRLKQSKELLDAYAETNNDLIEQIEKMSVQLDESRKRERKAIDVARSVVDDCNRILERFPDRDAD